MNSYEKSQLNPLREKPCLRGFPTSPSTTRVDQLQEMVEEMKSRMKVLDCDNATSVPKLKALISFADDLRLFVRICRFSYDMDSFLSKR